MYPITCFNSSGGNSQSYPIPHDSPNNNKSYEMIVYNTNSHMCNDSSTPLQYGNPQGIMIRIRIKFETETTGLIEFQSDPTILSSNNLSYNIVYEIDNTSITYNSQNPIYPAKKHLNIDLTKNINITVSM
jgi:hypothetical protein